LRALALAMSVVFVSGTPLQAWAQLEASQKAARAGALGIGADFDDAALGGSAADSPATAPSQAAEKPLPLRATAHAVLPVPLVPAQVEWGTAREGDPWALFYGRASTGLTQSTSGAVPIVVTLPGAAELGAVTVLGPAHGRLTIQNGDSTELRPLVGWEAIDLNLREGQWKRVPTTASEQRAQRLVTTWQSDGATGPSEIGFWGVDVPSRDAMDAELADRILAGPAAGTVTEKATPEEGHVSRVELGSGAPQGRSSDAVFSAPLAVDPRSLSRAFLVYELTGLGHWTEAIRRINGLEAQGGALPPGDRPNDGGLQVEEIAPSWLRLGINEVRFLAPTTPGVPAYGVRHVRLVGVGHATLIETHLNAGSDGALRGHLDFAQTVQPHELAFDLRKPVDGELLVTPLGVHQEPQRIKLRDFGTGWNRIGVDAMRSTEGLDVSWKPARAKATRLPAASDDRLSPLGEIAITGTPLESTNGRLVVSHPLHGECVEHSARIRGFVEPRAGRELRSLRVLGHTLEVGHDGSFSFESSEPESARGKRWEVPLEAVLSDGAVLHSRVGMQPCLDTRDDGLKADEGAPFAAVVRAGQPATIAFAGAKLEIPAGAVDRDVSISVRPLVGDQIARMSPGIANVSPGGGGFRFGPHGLKFKKPVQVTLPYDAHALSRGAHERQIFSFFYDEPHAKWTRIGRVGGAAEGALTSLTEHFTDFINATIAMPDEAGPQPFDPNEMKGIKVGDAASGLDFIAPPQANSSGTANLSYPVELPPGRNGVEPKLAFTYSSTRANGWLGVGWDLSLPSIEIDTRFGVPRYSGNETYLLDGAQLTPSSAGGNLYVRRVEGTFERIQRNVDSSGCVTSWTTTDKTGTVFQYGGPGATLAGPGTCQNFRWGLTSVTDSYGNGLSVSYFTDHGSNGDTYIQIYPDTIRYTTNAQTPGLDVYRVAFVRDGGGRPDAIISGRSGFEVLTRFRLDHVDVSYQNQIIRSYAVGYKGDTVANFHKSLVESIGLFGVGGTGAGTALDQHTFEYDTNTLTGSGGINGFSGPQTQAMPPGWGQVLTSTGGEVDDGLSKTAEHNAGASASVGVGFPAFSVSANAGGNGGTNDTHRTDFDVNGDGLPDFLDDSGNVNFNFLNPALSVPGPAAGHLQYTNVGGLPSDFSHTSTVGWNVGVTGTVSILTAGVSYTRSNADENTVIADVNGDGFPDLAQASGGQFTWFRNDGTGHFTPQSSSSLGGIAAVPADGAFAQSEAAQGLRRIAPLERWTAPFDGQVIVTAPIAKLRAGGNGVVASIYQNGAPLWQRTIGPNDTSVCVPSPPGGCGGSGISINVSAGDRIYFTVDPFDDGTGNLQEIAAESQHNDVSWDPAIVYQNASSSALEPYGRFVYGFQQAEDFALAGRPAVTWAAPADGTVVLTGDFSKGSTSDEVTLNVLQNGTPVSGFPATLSSGGGTLPLGAGISIPVKGGDQIQVQVMSDSPIDPQVLFWQPQLTYQTFCKLDDQHDQEVCGAVSCAPNGCTIANDPSPDLLIPQNVVTQPLQVFVPAPPLLPLVPTQSFVAAAAGNVSIAGSVSLPTLPAGTATILVQGVNQLFSKQSVPLTQSGPITVSVSTTVAANAGDQIFFTVLSDVPISAASATVQANGASMPVNIRWINPSYNAPGVPSDPMSGGFHQWSTGFVNGELPFAESNIVFPTDASGHPPQPIPTFNYGLPVLQGTGNGAGPLWAGPAGGSYIASGLMGTARGSFNGGPDGGGGSGLNELRSSTTWNVDGTVGLSFGASISGSLSGGESFSSIDFFDFNGDRFPDSVTPQGIALGDGRGNFAAPLALNLPGVAAGSLRHSDLRGENATAGAGSTPISLTSRTDAKGRPLDTLTLGFALGENYQMTMNNLDWIDVNGDGLPDLVSHPYGDGSHFDVYLNYGYSLSASPIQWQSSSWTGPNQNPAGAGLLKTLTGPFDGGTSKVTVDQIRLYDSGANNVSVSANVSVSNFGGGVSAGVAYGISRTLVDLVDVNGDGLPDQVLKDPNNPGQLLVKMNLGSHFDTNEVPWTLPDWGLSPASGLDQAATVNVLAVSSTSGIGDPTAAGNPDNVLEFRRSRNYNVDVSFNVCFFVCVGGSAYYSWGNGWQHSAFTDVDGDGSVDQVMKVAGQNDDHVYAKLNQTAQTNLLTVVHRPLGGDITLGYSRAGNLVRPDLTPPVDMPTNKWVMTSVDKDDGNGNHYVQHITYDPSGFHDRVEREDYGFAKVTTAREDASTIEGDYSNHDFYRRGLRVSNFERDASSNLFDTEAVTFADPTSLGLTPLTGTFFPSESSRTTSHYEGTTAVTAGTAVSTTQTRLWDTVGNVTDMTDFGDVGAADDVHYHITYDPALEAAYIFRASEITAKDTNGNVLRDRSATYDSFGGLISLTNVITGGTDANGNTYSNTPATSTFTRDAFGNIITAVDPRGYTINTTYDSIAQTYVVQETDSFGYVTSSVPNYLFGTIASKTDTNGNLEMRTYDAFGRLQFVYGPNDIGASEATITCKYSEQGIGQNPFPAFSETDHKDVLNPGIPIATVGFVDGLQRAIQTKKSLEKDTGTGTIVGMSVSGALVFDVRGRIQQRGQPVFDSGAAQSFVTVPMLNPTTLAYDIQSRPTSTQTPDTALTTVAYGIDTFSGGARLATTVRDANVNAVGSSLPGAPVETIRDVRGSILATKQTNRLDGVHPTALLTSYAYDPLEELVTVVDAKGNVTSAQYDSVGRMLALNSPDAGLTTFSHDLSGNLVARQTAQLRASGQSIRYQYDFNRLQQITYPTSPSVTYFYGDPSEAGILGFNRAGRIKEEDSEAGVKTYQYDALGNVVEQEWTLNSIKQAPDQTYSQSIGYAYDSFGRLLTIFFRDGETVTYGYDRGGNVTSAIGVDQHGNKTPYLQHLGYDEFAQRERLVSGNGVTTTYGYDPLTRRLTQTNASELDPTLAQKKAPPRPFQALRYSYDLVGNLTQIQNLAPFDDTLKGQILVGPKTENLAYDDLYQLKTADGVYQESSKQKFTYGLNFSYDAIGNVLGKTQTSNLVKLNGGGASLPQKGQTYSSTYTYAGSRPHAPTEVDETDVAAPKPIPRTISYDPSGNQIGWVTQGDTRTVVFNEEDRTISINDNGKNAMRALYDGSGDRAIKLHETGGNEEIAYFGANLTARDGDAPSKHIFVGTQRIATKASPDDNGGQAPMVFYFHDDHLGSTNFLTDTTQTLAAHEEYLPTGELWVDETSDPLHVETPYLFTGKELDVETGYYYFGARYYDPHLSMWTSPDPLLAQYVHDKRRPAGLPQSMSEVPRAQTHRDPASPEATSRFAWGENAAADHLLDPSWWSPYTYASNNPAIYIDPDGRKIIFLSDAKPEFVAEFKIAVKYLKDHKASFVIDALEASPVPVLLVQGSTGQSNFQPYCIPTGCENGAIGGRINWDPWTAVKATATRGGVRSPANRLSHEADHALSYIKNPAEFLERDKDLPPGREHDRWRSLEEKRVIQGSEKKVAELLGEAVRTQHWSKGYHVQHADQK
jgi:RHS repeat-associated protein